MALWLDQIVVLHLSRNISARGRLALWETPGPKLMVRHYVGWDICKTWPICNPGRLYHYRRIWILYHSNPFVATLLSSKYGVVLCLHFPRRCLFFYPPLLQPPKTTPCHRLISFLLFPNVIRSHMITLRRFVCCGQRLPLMDLVYMSRGAHVTLLGYVEDQSCETFQFLRGVYLHSYGYLESLRFPSALWFWIDNFRLFHDSCFALPKRYVQRSWCCVDLLLLVSVMDWLHLFVCSNGLVCCVCQFYVDYFVFFPCFGSSLMLIIPFYCSSIMFGIFLCIWTSACWWSSWLVGRLNFNFPWGYSFVFFLRRSSASSRYSYPLRVNSYRHSAMGKPYLLRMKMPLHKSRFLSKRRVSMATALQFSKLNDENSSITSSASSASG